MTRRSRAPVPAVLPGAVLVAVVLAGIVLVAALVLAPAAHAQDRVGTVAQAEGQVQGTAPGGSAAALAAGDGLVLDHLVETARASAARMTFGRHGVLTLGQEARVRLDQATVDQATGRERSVLEVLVGKIELALGSLFSGEATVETPAATLGVKGTVFRVLVEPSGRTTVAVLEGLVGVTAKAGGSVDVAAGEWTVVEMDGPPAQPAPFDRTTGTLSAAASGPDFAVPGEDLFLEPVPGERDGQGIDLPGTRPPFPNDDGGTHRSGGNSGGGTGGGG